MKIFAFIAGLLLLASCATPTSESVSTTAGGVNVDGTWKGRYTPAMGGQPMDLTYNFKADGKTLTGTVSGPPEDPWLEIKNGKIDGDKISFKVDVDFQGMKMKFNYKGDVKGDEIKLSFTTEMAGGMGGGMGSPPPERFTVKRVN